MGLFVPFVGKIVPVNGTTSRKLLFSSIRYQG